MTTAGTTGLRLTEPGALSRLPEDMADRAVARFRVLLLLSLALSAVALIVAGINLALEIGTSAGARAGVALHGVLFALEALMFAIARSAIRGRRIIAVALVWQVAVCAAVSIINPWIVFEEQGVIPRVTWTSLLIIIVPLILPARPRHALYALAASALTVPAGLVALELTGAITLDGQDLVGGLVSPALALALAMISSWITFSYARDLTKARSLGGNYEREERLGRGGMGEVWRYRHRLLDRPAAIKQIRPDRLTGDAAIHLARFTSEAKALASLRSPHTVELYDFNQTEDGALFYVMELLEGLTLETLIKRFGVQPPARVIHVLRQVCHSLGEAHEVGLVHRDIKPENIFACRLGRDVDVIKVLDFGLVGVDGKDGMAGTSGFRAPEILRGAEPDHRADLWALGQVAQRLLYGDPNDPVDEHPGLDAIIDRCLATEPDDRWQSADEIAAALAKLEVDEPWTDDRARTWWRENQPEIASAAAAQSQVATATASDD